jgi:hypothetical protein
MPSNPAEILLGLLLIFFLPGYGVVVATFPEWRIRGPQAWERGLTTIGLAIVLSIALTVVSGYALLSLGPTGFTASWTQPQLEILLSVVAVLGIGIGALRGAFERNPPLFGPKAPEEPDPYEMTRELDRLRRESRRARRSLPDIPDRAGQESAHRELEAIETEIQRIQRELEAEYVQ